MKGVVLGLVLFLATPALAQQYYQQPDPQYQQQPRPLSGWEKFTIVWSAHDFAKGYLNLKRAENGQQPIMYPSQPYQTPQQYHYQPMQTTEIQPYQPMPNPGAQYTPSQPIQPVFQRQQGFPTLPTGPQMVNCSRGLPGEVYCR